MARKESTLPLILLVRDGLETTFTRSHASLQWLRRHLMIAPQLLGTTFPTVEIMNPLPSGRPSGLRKLPRKVEGVVTTTTPVPSIILPTLPSGRTWVALNWILPRHPGPIFLVTRSLSILLPSIHY